MALTYLTLKVSNPSKPQLTFSKKFLVDTGAPYSIVDEKFLNKIKVKEKRIMQFVMPNGQKTTQEICDVMFTYKDKTAPSPVVFGDQNIFVVGKLTLETFGLGVDFTTRKLIEIPKII